MTDGTVTVIVAGLLQITILVVGFLTLWVKLRYGAEKAAEAVIKAQLVEDKLDANSLTTSAVDAKADTIVNQTNGTMDALRDLVGRIAIRVEKLEEHNRISSHRVLDTLNALHLKVAELTALQPRPVTVMGNPKPTEPDHMGSIHK